MTGRSIQDALDGAITQTAERSDKEKLDEFFLAIQHEIPIVLTLSFSLFDRSRLGLTTVDVEKLGPLFLETWRKLHAGRPLLNSRLVTSRQYLDRIRPDDYRVQFGADLVYGDTACETVEDVILLLHLECALLAKLSSQELTADELRTRLDLPAFQQCCDAARQEVLQLDESTNATAGNYTRIEKSEHKKVLGRREKNGNWAPMTPGTYRSKARKGELGIKPEFIGDRRKFTEVLTSTLEPLLSKFNAENAARHESASSG